MEASKQVLRLAAAGAACLLLAIHLVSLRSPAPRELLETSKLYNKWGTNDNNEHWGGVGSENYHTAKYDKTGYNENYHPRDSASGDGVSMEPAWWRNGPGANSEVTGHAMDGELYDPPHEKVFKPFFMKQKAQSRTLELYDLDGPSPLDKPRSAWTKAGHGTTYWMLNHEGPTLASQQEIYPEPPQAKQLKLPRVGTLASKAKVVKAKQANMKHLVFVKTAGAATGAKVPAAVKPKGQGAKSDKQGLKKAQGMPATGAKTSKAAKGAKMTHAELLKAKILSAQPSKQG